MNSMEEIYGLAFDRGKVRGILTLEKSQKTAAITEQQAEVDIRWGGKALTSVRLTPKTDDWCAGLDLMANKTTELSIQWRRFLQAEYPGDRLADLEKVLDAAQAEGTFPCIVNRPMTSVISAGIGRNSGVIRALVGAPDAPVFVGSLFDVLNAQARAHALPYGWDRFQWNEKAITAGFLNDMREGTFNGNKAWKLSEMTLICGAALTDKENLKYVVLVPLEEGGAAPFLAKLDKPPTIDKTKRLDSEWELRKANDIGVKLLYPLKWSITYVQNDIPLASPVKTLIAGAALTHLLDYMQGIEVSPGAHKFSGATPIDICRRVLGYLYRQAIDRYMFNPVEKFWDGDDAKMIQAILDFCYAMDRRQQLKTAIANRPDVVLFMNTLLLSGLAKGVRKGQITMPPVDDEFAEWLVDSIISKYWVTSSSSEMRSTKYSRLAFNWRDLQMPKGLSEAEQKIWQQAFDAADKGAQMPAPYSFDYVSTDYVANALITMLRDSIPVILKALRGEWPGITVIQYSESMVDLDVTVSILEALEYALKMDSSSLMSKAQFTLPYRTLFWASMYSTFTCRVPRRPIAYGITDLTAGLGRQAKAFAKILATKKDIGDGKDKLAITDLSSIFQYGGFSYLQYGPDLDIMIRDELAPGLELPSAVFGDTVALEPSNQWLTNAPTAHGDVEVTTVIPCWDASAWRIYADMLQSQTLKSYFAVPVTDQICKVRTLSVDISRLSRWTRDIMRMLGLPTAVDGKLASSVSIQYPSFPALYDTALVIPYIREYEHQKLCAQDLDHSMEIELDPANSYWNMSGTILLPETQPDVPGVTPWRVPSYQAGFAGKRTPSGVYSMPVVFNAQR